jgi:hypothetical protein
MIWRVEGNNSMSLHSSNYWLLLIRKKKEPILKELDWQNALLAKSLDLQDLFIALLATCAWKFMIIIVHGLELV